METQVKNTILKNESLTDEFSVRQTDTMRVHEGEVNKPWYANIKYLVIGVLFGIIFVKAEIISWFRIQEMFRFQSFHMYGVIGSAVVTGMISVWLIRKFDICTFDGEKVIFQKKEFNKGQIYGGLLFGFGWALTGACPGPLFAQIGSGATVIIVALLSAIAGTWVYGYFRDNLPH